MSEGHTPLPWRQLVLLVVDGSGNKVAHCTRWEGGTPKPGVAEANAALIVTAVNQHEALRSALRASDEVLLHVATWGTLSAAVDQKVADARKANALLLKEGK